MKQHALKLWEFLHPQDVGADNIRPRAIDNRPYGFFIRLCVFCNSPFSVLCGLMANKKKE